MEEAHAWFLRIVRLRHLGQVPLEQLRQSAPPNWKLAFTFEARAQRGLFEFKALDACAQIAGRAQ